MSAADTARALSRTAGELLVTAGVLVLLFGIWQLWWTDIGAGRDQRAVTQHLTSSWSRGHASASVARSGGGAPATPAAPEGSEALDPATSPPPVLAVPGFAAAFAVVHIPRFGTSWQVAVAEGVELRPVLDRGVLGHYPGTAMPGGVGDFAMAGHRTTYGHPMNQIAELVTGDPVVVETAQAWYVYRVTGHEIVAPTDVGVIAPVADHPGAAPTDRTITFTACHPEYSARQRYVVHGTLVSWHPRGAGPPTVLSAPAASTPGQG